MGTVTTTPDTSEQETIVHPDRDAIVAMVRAGARVKPLAARLGIPWSTVYKWVKAAGIVLKDPRPEQALALLREGMGPKSVARAVGASRRSIYNWMQRARLSPAKAV